MGSGMAQVGVLVLLTVVVLPCCFFTLLALLDRFERSLAPTLETPATPAVAELVTELVTEQVTELPVAAAVRPEPELVTLDMATARVAISTAVASPARAAV
jgi:hypothetical protein